MKDLNLSQIKSIINQASEEEFHKLSKELRQDNRKGVHKILNEKKRYLEKNKAEILRIHKMMAFDESFGVKLIAGIDEVGRGPLAGPVVAACVIMDFNNPILGINDSKKLSKQKREELYDQIINHSLFCAIGEADNKTIDDRNILNATFLAMHSAIEHIQKQILKKNDTLDLLLIDGNQKIPHQNIHQKAIIKGDSKSYSIACASILAKVYRDRLMEKMDILYPEYDFASNVGYGTEVHITALKKFGLTPIHRKSFCSNFLR